ncbi:MAG: metallophosphoesterase [bacterium]|nr:metallophosphoesterase [bacterium]
MPVRFVFLTDTHHHPNAPKDFGAPKMLTRSHEIHRAIPPAVNALAPDFIVHGGDLLCGGGSFELPRKAYLQSIHEVAETFSNFQAPFYCVPGNHDCDAQKGSLDAFARAFTLPEPLTIVDAAPRLRLALANIYHTCNPIETNTGIWSDALDDALREAAQKALNDCCALILIVHTWILPAEDEGKALVQNADLLIDTLTQSPAIIAAFTGHRHRNRITYYRDFLVLDTACLIGFPLGFRQICLLDDGYFHTTFHQLDLPDLIQASYDRSPPEANNRWQGEIPDRDTEIFLPRLKALWG